MLLEENSEMSGGDSPVEAKSPDGSSRRLLLQNVVGFSFGTLLLGGGAARALAFSQGRASEDVASVGGVGPQTSPQGYRAVAPQASSAPLLGKKPYVGCNFYTHTPLEAGYLEGLRVNRPMALRWILEWDRIHLQRPGGPIIPSPPNWETFEEFFALLAASPQHPEPIKLIIQIWVKDPMWAGFGISFQGQQPGTQWAKPAVQENFPVDIEQSYGVFLTSLQNKLTQMGVTDVEWGAWNEADARLKAGLQGMKRDTSNHAQPWRVNPLEWSWWSGGTGEKWEALHTALPGASFTSSGVYGDHWIASTAALPTVSTIDLHRYTGGDRSAHELVQHVEERLGRWDAAAPSGLKRPFVLGECASNSKHSLLTVKESARLWQGHRLLQEAHNEKNSALYGRYKGMMAHVALPADNASNPNWSWWQYRPEYDQYLLPE